MSRDGLLKVNLEDIIKIRKILDKRWHLLWCNFEERKYTDLHIDTQLKIIGDYKKHLDLIHRLKIKPEAYYLSTEDFINIDTICKALDKECEIMKQYHDSYFWVINKFPKVAEGSMSGEVCDSEDATPESIADVSCDESKK